MTFLFWFAAIVGVAWGGYEMLRVFLDPYRDRFEDITELLERER